MDSKRSRSTRTKLLVATTNPGKAREIGRFLAGLPFEVVSLAEILPGLSYRERGKTFLENARGKSLYYGRKSGLLTLAEDSGLEVDALDGAPGVHSARFALPNPDDAKNLRKVLAELEGVPWKDRKGRFVCTMVLSKEGRVVREIRGEVRGTIAFSPKGENGFGYDPIFYYSHLKKHFAELSMDEKNAVSHRGRALRRLRSALAGYRDHGPDERPGPRPPRQRP
ncbi:MAG: RdgB/HAM1 family non-canonical purine NTP pyrophosphatase [Candidatus Aminicenantales bacterium]